MKSKEKMVADPPPPSALDISYIRGGGKRVISAKSAPSFQLNPTLDQWSKINGQHEGNHN